MKLNSIIVLLCVVFTLNAQNANNKSIESQLKKTSEEIAVIEQLKLTLGSKINDVLTKLSLTSQEITARKKVIFLLNSEIESLNEEIKTIEKKIEVLETELEHKKANYAKSRQQMHRHNSVQDKYLFILSGKDFTVSYNRMRNLKRLADLQKKQAEEIVVQQEKLKVQQQELFVSKSEKIARIQQQEQEEKNLKQTESSQQKEITNLKKKEKDIQKELNKKNKQKENLNRQFDKAIAKKERDYAITPEARSLSSNFASNKGQLPFPLTGKYRITGNFGIQKQEKFEHITRSNNGIDIQTLEPNSDAKSVFEGKVTSVFTELGYNHVIIIRHGDYLTLYANLSEVYVKEKDKVQTGQSLGKIFTDHSGEGATILHFELRKEKIPLNPEDWLVK